MDTQTPLFEQSAVQRKMSAFHSKLMTLEFHHCNTSLESFPDLTMAAAGYTGHVINLPQDFVSFAHSLPKLPSDITAGGGSNSRRPVASIPRRSIYGAHLPSSFMPNAQQQQAGQFASPLRNDRVDQPTH